MELVLGAGSSGVLLGLEVITYSWFHMQLSSVSELFPMVSSLVGGKRGSIACYPALWGFVEILYFTDSWWARNRTAGLSGEVFHFAARFSLLGSS